MHKTSNTSENLGCKPKLVEYSMLSDAKAQILRLSMIITAKIHIVLLQGVSSTPWVFIYDKMVVGRAMVPV